ncbi:hypothetical protein [Achromobacter ruhlandii]|uniref:hypothetical protein n=1 Tax=Achromobacter ruhlandii TaxID=72557 RepID=UPI001EEF11DD|nr:hypothetical protein [Achromobacter ruhlandii]
MTTTTPAGHKLVPIEPTDDMLDAGCGQHSCVQGDPWYSSPDLSWSDCKDIYAAMLAAAPASPVSTVEDERQAFEAWAEDQGFVLDCDFFEVSGQYYDQDDTQLAYDIWRAARASVAAPAAGDAQKEPMIVLSGQQLLDALEFVAPDREPLQLECTVAIQFGEGHSGAGHYCWLDDSPDEGAILLRPEPDTTDELDSVPDELAAQRKGDA